MDKLTRWNSSALPFNPERLTERILALSDMAVVLTRDPGEILYCSQSMVTVLGLSNEDVLKGGWAYLHSCFHPDDLKLFQQKALPSLKRALRKVPERDRPRCVFNYTTRIRHARGHYVLAAVENQPVEWHGRGWPQVYMTVLKNITPFGNNHKMMVMVSRQEESRQFINLHQQSFDFRWEPFTDREVEVIRLIAQGLTSKQMAVQLHISPETVRNHRKNILLKSQCSSSTELSAFASQKRML